MTAPTPADLEALLARVGVGLPRGVLGDAAWALAALIDRGGGDPAHAVAAVSAAHWPAMRRPVAAALARVRAAGPDAQVDRAIALADDASADGPLATAVAALAGRSLAAVLGRTRARLERLGSAGSAAVARAAGETTVDLLDLDCDDFAPEIETYVAAGADEAALRALARATGDDEIRTWAWEELRDLFARGRITGALGPGGDAVRRLALDGGPPADAADDPLWIAVVVTLAEGAVERALVEEGRGG